MCKIHFSHFCTATHTQKKSLNNTITLFKLNFINILLCHLHHHHIATFYLVKVQHKCIKKKFKESKEFVHMLIIKKYHTPKSHSNLVSPERLFNLKSIIKCLKVLKCELHILIVCQFFFIIIFMIRKVIKVNCLKYFFDDPIIISSEDVS